MTPAPERASPFSEEDVERAAKAMFEAEHKNIANCWAWDSDGLDIEHPGLRDRWLKRARAALAVLAPKLQTAEAQLREADAVIHFECEEEDGTPHSDAEMIELDQWEQEAIARHRARSA